ncbi:hypothetical protein I4U23_021929 [Adineta vaga]|nr:hypothetical protein I4U23_021929 [Adineta vaga]
MNEDYNENSHPQMVAVNSTIKYIHEAINVLDITNSSPPYVISDFGSSLGPNGRSFYESCLPSNSLLIGYSSTSLHWLSHKPCNISNHCASLFAQGDELKAFQEQARGVLILLIPCVDDHGSNGFDILREILYQCAQLCLTSQELLEYTFPIHARSYAECVDIQLFDCFSFELIESEFNSVQMPFIQQWHNKEITQDEFIKLIVSYVRSWSESILKQTLMTSNRSREEIEQIQSQFWSLYSDELRKEFNQLLDTHMNFTYLILKKKND